MARSSRSRVRSSPSATMVSNSGGVAVRPVTATRMAMNRSPTFQPCASATRAQRRLELVGLERHAACAGDGRPRGDQTPASRRCVPALGDQQRRVELQVVDPQEADQLADGVELGQPLRDHRQEGPQLVVLGHPVDPAGAQLGGDERPETLDEIVRVQPADPLPVEPFEPLPVEHRAALVDVGQLEALDDLVDRQDLLLGPGRPAEQRQVVDQRLADEPLGDVVGDRRLALALAHLGPVRIEDQRQVRKARLGMAEGPEHQDLLGGVREVVLAADDLADLHRRVIDHHGEVVQGRPVASNDHEVATEVDDVELHAATDDVVERDDAGADPEAQGGLPALRRPRGPLGGRQRRAAPDVPGREPGRLLGFPIGVELLRRAIARVGLVVSQEPVGCLRVERQAEHLAIWREGPAGRLAGHLRPLVPMEAQPVQAVEDVLLVRDRAARLIGVLQAQDERPAGMTGVEVVEQGRPGRADVERSGRARGDPDAGRGHPRAAGSGT